MRGLRLFASMLLVAGSASATTMVALSNYVSCISGSSAAILVTQDGKRISAARVDVYREIENGERAVWRGATDDNGEVKTPEIKAGNYRVFVDAGKDSGTVDLIVNSEIKTTSLCELKFAVPPLSEADILDELAGEAPRIRLKEFRGIVDNESGALIPRMKIKVFRRGMFDKYIAEVESADINHLHEVGQFHLDLNNGDYVAFFNQMGFRRQAIAFTIDKDGWNGFKVRMIIAGSSTRNPLPAEWDPDK